MHLLEKKTRLSEMSCIPLLEGRTVSLSSRNFLLKVTKSNRRQKTLNLGSVTVGGPFSKPQLSDLTLRVNIGLKCGNAHTW